MAVLHVFHMFDLLVAIRALKLTHLTCILSFDHSNVTQCHLQFAAESDVTLSKCRHLMTKYCRQLMMSSQYIQQTQSLNDFSGAYSVFSKSSYLILVVTVSFLTIVVTIIFNYVVFIAD